MYGLVNLVFVGALIFYVVRQVGRRRSVNPAPLPEVLPTAAVEPTPFHQAPAPAQPKSPALVKTSLPATARGGRHRYIIRGQRGGTSGDRTKAMLQMMSGPGICTPVDR